MREDRRLRALETAQQAWKDTAWLGLDAKMELVRELYSYQMFSLTQLSKICRVSTATLSRKMRPNSGGGRFEPATLTSLIVLRKIILLGDPVDKLLLRVIVNGGTSISTAARLTGAAENTLYMKHKELGRKTA